MFTAPLFPSKLSVNDGWEDSFMIIIACLLALLVISLLILHKRRQEISKRVYCIPINRKSLRQ